jgi:hypothetical protein
MIIIIGGGISGLNAGVKLLDKYNDVVIYEKSNYLGGRIYTSNHKIGIKKISYECGAARFNRNHNQIISLIKKYGLHKNMYKLPKGWETIFTQPIESDYFDNLDEILNDLNKKAKKISKKKLQNTTLLELCKIIYDSKTTEFLKHSYPYYSELAVLNSYDALKLLEKDLNDNHTFYVLNGGLSVLIEEMKQDFIKKGGKINLGYKLDDFIEINSGFECKFTNEKDKTNKLEKNVIKCESLILACDGANLKKMKPLKRLGLTDLINSVKCEPLYRMYAVYKKCWFKDIPKIVTNENIQYIIPIDYNSGLIMISYTDGAYSKKWKKIMDNDDKNNKNQKKELMRQLNLIFPDLKIEDPTHLYNHYWNHGACYWKPGVNSDKLKSKILKPTKHNLFICGDSYSSRQAWMEGALDTSNEILKFF